MASHDAPSELNGSALTHASDLREARHPPVAAKKRLSKNGPTPGQTSIRTDQSLLDEAADEEVLAFVAEKTFSTRVRPADVLRMALVLGMKQIREMMAKQKKT